MIQLKILKCNERLNPRIHGRTDSLEFGNSYLDLDAQISDFLLQLFSTVDLLSYIGGVLGLCLGFSAMSCLECMYFFTLRLGLNMRLNRDEPDVTGGLFENA